MKKLSKRKCYRNIKKGLLDHCIIRDVIHISNFKALVVMINRGDDVKDKQA